MTSRQGFEFFVGCNLNQMFSSFINGVYFVKFSKQCFLTYSTYWRIYCKNWHFWKSPLNGRGGQTFPRKPYISIRKYRQVICDTVFHLPHSRGGFSRTNGGGQWCNGLRFPQLTGWYRRGLQYPLDGESLPRNCCE